MRNIPTVEIDFKCGIRQNQTCVGDRNNGRDG